MPDQLGCRVDGCDYTGTDVGLRNHVNSRAKNDADHREAGENAAYRDWYPDAFGVEEDDDPPEDTGETGENAENDTNDATTETETQNTDSTAATGDAAGENGMVSPEEYDQQQNGETDIDTGKSAEETGTDGGDADRQTDGDTGGFADWNPVDSVSFGTIMVAATVLLVALVAYQTYTRDSAGSAADAPAQPENTGSDTDREGTDETGGESTDSAGDAWDGVRFE